MKSYEALSKLDEFHFNDFPETVTSLATMIQDMDTITNLVENFRSLVDLEIGKNITKSLSDRVKPEIEQKLDGKPEQYLGCSLPDRKTFYVAAVNRFDQYSAPRNRKVLQAWESSRAVLECGPTSCNN